MKNKIWFLILLGLTTIGCDEKVVYITAPSTTKTDTLMVTPKTTIGQTVNLIVDWNKFIQSSVVDGTSSNTAELNSIEINQVGSRLVYLAENAAFTQVVNKTSLSQPQLITLQVPPTDSADLYIVAAGRCSGCSRPIAVKLGVKRKIRIGRDTLINLTLDSLSLTDARWVVDEIDSSYVISNDTIFVNRPISDGTLYNSLKIKVSDPYQYGINVPFIQTMFVGFYGSGRVRGNIDGMRLFEIDLVNTVTKFSPKVNGYMFGLVYDPIIGNEGIVVTNFVNP